MKLTNKFYLILGDTKTDVGSYKIRLDSTTIKELFVVFMQSEPSKEDCYL